MSNSDVTVLYIHLDVNWAVSSVICSQSSEKAKPKL